ncbi:MAG: hypothetical protein LCH41_00090 [Armatimonadetes bacterium]|nr:hypothetical protein [Armatimonadota bacterium]
MKLSLSPLTLALVLAPVAFSAGRNSGQDRPPTEVAVDNARLAEIYKQDQADRQGPIENLDWEKVSARDQQRQDELKAMLARGEVVTGQDYFHAAMVFQHSMDKQGYKLAHELAWIGASMGNRSAKWLSAASWDRLLVSLGENQRFGTQYRQKDPANHKPGDKMVFELTPVDDDGATDGMRKALDCPTLEEAKRRAADF